MPSWRDDEKDALPGRRDFGHFSYFSYVRNFAQNQPIFFISSYRNGIIFIIAPRWFVTRLSRGYYIMEMQSDLLFILPDQRLIFPIHSDQSSIGRSLSLSLLLTLPPFRSFSFPLAPFLSLSLSHPLPLFAQLILICHLYTYFSFLYSFSLPLFLPLLLPQSLLL